MGKQKQGMNFYFDGCLQIDYKEELCVHFNAYYNPVMAMAWATCCVFVKHVSLQLAEV